MGYVPPENPVLSLRPADPGDTPLLQHMKIRSKERQKRSEKREKKRWRGDSNLGYIDEEPKKKWRCHECGSSKHLEEDPDNLGTFYCTRCWEAWETSHPAKPKKKKKK